MVKCSDDVIVNFFKFGMFMCRDTCHFWTLHHLLGIDDIITLSGVEGCGQYKSPNVAACKFT